MSEKQKKTCKYLNYVEHFLVLVSTATSCISTFSFTSLVYVPNDITSSAVGLKLFAIIAWIKKCKSIIKKRDEEAW